MPTLKQVNIKYWRYYDDDELSPEHPPVKPSRPGEPEQPIQPPEGSLEDRVREALEVAKAKLEDLRAALEDNKDDVVASIKGRVENAVATIKAKIDELKAAAGSPEQPIFTPDRRAEIEARVKQALDYIKEHAGDKIAAIKAKAESLLNQAIAKINEIRASLPKPEHPIYIEDPDGAREQLKAKLDEVKAKLAGHRPGQPLPPTPPGEPELPSRIDGIKNYLDNCVVIIPEHKLLEPVKPIVIKPEVQPL